MIIKDTIIRFDWAAKRMLRDKANFDVLEGRVEGRAEGEKAKALDIAKKMKSLGLSEDVIGRTTGLPVEWIRAL